MAVKLTTAQHESGLFTYIVHQALERIATQNANNNYRSLSRRLFSANLNITHEPIYKNEVKLHNFTRVYLKL
jgi:hypothetical protein